MNNLFESVITNFALPLSIRNLIKGTDSVLVYTIPNEYTKIQNLEYSMYFQNNKLVLITKDNEEIKKVFSNIEDAMDDSLFASTDLKRSSI